MNSEKTEVTSPDTARSTKRRTRSRKHRKRRTNSEMSPEEGATENTAILEEDKLAKSTNNETNVKEEDNLNSLSLENKYLNAGGERKRKTGDEHESGAEGTENMHPSKIPKVHRFSELYGSTYTTGLT